MIDREGYRHNVGIILVNPQGQLFWARRIGEDSWQFPQGGIRAHETPEDALFRELAEEVGLLPVQVEMMGATRGWLRYRLPPHLIRHNSHPICIGQKQKWFLMRLLADTEKIRFDLGDKPEFDHWRWVDHEAPVNEVVSFKRGVYQRALDELIPLINTQQD